MLGKSKRSGLKKLQEFVETHEGVEGYLEPQTPILPQSLLLIARNGEWARAPAPDRGQAAGFCKKFSVPFYDAAIVGYPERMRGAKGVPAPESPTVDQLQAWWAQDKGEGPDEEKIDE